MTTKQSGFALVELLIVLTIIIIFAGLSLAYYRNFDEQKKLEGEAKQLVDVLNLASKKAHASDLSPDPNCSTFLGYRVIITTSSTYELQFNCGGSYSTIQEYSLQSGVSFLIAGTSVLFKPLSVGTNLTNPVTTTLKNSAINKCREIQINPVGTVEENSVICP